MLFFKKDACFSIFRGPWHIQILILGLFAIIPPSVIMFSLCNHLFSEPCDSQNFEFIHSWLCYRTCELPGQRWPSRYQDHKTSWGEKYGKLESM